MIYDYIFYYLSELFKLFKSDDYKYFNPILILSVVAFSNIMLIILVIKAFDIIKIPKVDIIETGILISVLFSILYFRYGYKKKYRIRVKTIENSTKKQKIKYLIFSVIYVLVSFSLPFIWGGYFNVSLLK